MHAREARSPSLPSPDRQLVHDLRNLFGIVASARNCLGDLPQDDRSLSLLDAIEQAALRGSALTTELLAERKRDSGSLDVGRRLEALEPMLRAITGRTVDLRLDIGAGRCLVGACPDDFDAVLVELVVNACKALRTRGRVVVRTRRAGETIRIMVADNGRGMSDLAARAAERGQYGPTGAHGTGLGRIHHFAGDADGRLRIRSRPGRGTIVALTLPLAAARLLSLLPANPHPEGAYANRSRAAA